MSRESTWLSYNAAAGRITVTLHVQPGARKSEIAGFHGDALKIRIAAPAMENKANAELVEFLSELLGIARSMVIIRHGTTGRRKIVEVAGGPELTAKLEAIAGRSTIHDPRSPPTSR